jgi:carbonic anhydrase
MSVETSTQNGTCSIDDLEFAISNHALQANFPTTDSTTSTTPSDNDSASCAASTFVNPLFPNRSWRVDQFHIHLSSEHTVDDVGFGGELHMLHRAEVGAGDSLAVVALFLVPTAKEDNMAFSLMLERFKKVANKTMGECGLNSKESSPDGGVVVAANSQPLLESSKADVSSWNLYDLIPEGTGFYVYDGGLTTPPCTEIVQWSVAQLPVEVSVDQYAQLVDTLLSHVDPKTCQGDSVASPSGSTSRPIQPSNGRAVELVCPVDSSVKFSGYKYGSEGGEWWKLFGIFVAGAASTCCFMGFWSCACHTRPQGYRRIKSGVD